MNSNQVIRAEQADISAAEPKVTRVLYAAIRGSEPPAQPAVPSQFTLAAAGAEGNAAPVVAFCGAVAFLSLALGVSAWWWLAFTADLIAWGLVVHAAARARRTMRDLGRQSCA